MTNHTTHLTLTQTPAWHALQAHCAQLSPRHLNALFAEDPQRFEKFALPQAGLLFDFSKQRVTQETLQHLIKLAEARDLTGFIRRMATGEAINTTENRAALHIALRAQSPFYIDGVPALAAQIQEVSETRQRMRAIVDKIRSGNQIGASGASIRHIVNLGVGGSDLGPRMAAFALADQVIDVRFVANIDPAEFKLAVRDLNPAETLFIVSSKTFTTQETLANAQAARDWLGATLGNEKTGAHFLAATNNVKAAVAFGIAPDRCFPLPEWVGGRYSLWSAIGLPLACAIGMDAFEELLAGAADMDTHFINAPFAENMPVLMALIGIWNINFLGATSLAVIPYAHRLGLLPAYLQQLDMESNGKHVTREGQPVDYATAPIVWGSAGTVGQHAFHQLFYQGTHLTPIDFIVPVNEQDGKRSANQEALVANALAQSAALMKGKSLEEAHAELISTGLDAEKAAQLAPHLTCAGNQPSSTLLMSALTPRTLGNLVALYEHKVAVQGWIWNVNSFDQFGVEYGKKMAREILPKMLAGVGDFDCSTKSLLATIQNWNTKKTTDNN